MKLVAPWLDLESFFFMSLLPIREHRGVGLCPVVIWRKEMERGSREEECWGPPVSPVPPSDSCQPPSSSRKDEETNSDTPRHSSQVPLGLRESSSRLMASVILVPLT